MFLQCRERPDAPLTHVEGLTAAGLAAGALQAMCLQSGHGRSGTRTPDILRVRHESTWPARSSPSPFMARLIREEIALTLCLRAMPG
jgi:hypothetical protein